MDDNPENRTVYQVGGNPHTATVFVAFEIAKEAMNHLGVVSDGPKSALDYGIEFAEVYRAVYKKIQLDYNGKDLSDSGG